MDKKELLELYEKLYFHEIEVREKLNERLQAPLTLIIAFVGVIAYLLQNYEHKEFTTTSLIFLGVVGATSVCVAVSIYFFIRSWYNNLYSFLPSANETEKYRKVLLNQYATYPNGEELANGYFKDFLSNYYVSCSTINAVSNDYRSAYVHKTNARLILTALLGFSAFLVFYIGGLDRTRKPTEVTLLNPIHVIQGVPMNTINGVQTPQPPPPLPASPPPPRQIREGVVPNKR